jgi:hypothetical protein
VTCSLSFSAKSPLSDPLLLDELPRSELLKLDGPATIDGDSLQVSVHNGTSWELREVVIGLTIVNNPERSSNYGQARIVPAVTSSQPVQDRSQKLPDITMLLRVKGSAAPTTTASFRTALNFALFPDQEWHWAIVKAKGIPPQASPASMMQSEQAASSLLPLPSEAGKQVLPSNAPSDVSPSNSDDASQ